MQAVGLGIIGWLVILPAMQLSANHGLDWLQTIIAVSAMTVGAWYACIFWFKYVQKNYAALMFWKHHAAGRAIFFMVWGGLAVAIYYNVPMIPDRGNFSESLQTVMRFLCAALYAFPLALLSQILLGYIPAFDRWMDRTAIDLARRGEIPDADMPPLPPEPSGWEPPRGAQGNVTALDFSASRFRKE